MGVTNDVTVAVWVGYDNADGKRRTLGGGATGGGVAVPIFEPVIQAVWAHVAPKAALAPPSPEAKRQLACKSVDLDSGEVQERGERDRRGITECFRVDGKGKIVDTRVRLVSRENGHAKHDRDDDDSPRGRRAHTSDDNPERSSGRSDWSRDPWRGAPQLGWQQRWDGGQWGRW